MAAVVYALCAITSAVCVVLLIRGYRRSKARLLIWSALCFIGFTINNVMLFGDKIIWPHVDLRLFRTGPALVGLLFLLYGLIWDSK